MAGSERDLFEMLREWIMEGRYDKGEYINCSELGSAFKVSQVPIREVMIRLSERGLLIWEKKRGFKVASCSLAECLSLLQLNRTIFSNSLNRLSTLCFSVEQFTKIEQDIAMALNSPLPCWMAFSKIFFQYSYVILSEFEYHLFRLSYDRVHFYHRSIFFSQPNEIYKRLKQLTKVIAYTRCLKKDKAISGIQKMIDNDIRKISLLINYN
jgi:DNA-binding GntR family transcriptional regulator